MAKRKIERFLLAADSHGDMIDPSARRAFFEFCADFKPDIRIHIGDAFDLRPFRGSANADERQESMTADIEAGLDFLTDFDPQVFILGNHDWRLQKVMVGANGPMADLANQLWGKITDSIPNTKIVPYGKREGVYQLGDHKLIHGYHSGMYAARQAAAAYGNVIMGHVHAPGYSESPHINGASGYTSGCLCRLDMEYNKGHVNTLRQAHGWIYGLKIGGRLLVCQAKKVAGTWFLPTDFKEIKNAA